MLVPLVIAAAIGGILYARSQQRTRRTQTDCTHVGSSGGVIGGIRYLERVRGGADPEAHLPMVILFHSRGSRPENYEKGLQNIGPARLIIPEGSYGQDGKRSWWDGGVREIVESGGVEEAAKQWRDTSSKMRSFIRDVVRCRPTVGKPLVTGASQGGQMALLMTSRFPTQVKGAVAVAAYLLPLFWNSSMAETVMIHGTGDTTVPYAWAEAFADAMQLQGAAVEFLSFPAQGHTITSPMSKAWIEAVRSRL